MPQDLGKILIGLTAYKNNNCSLEIKLTLDSFDRKNCIVIHNTFNGKSNLTYIITLDENNRAVVDKFENNKHFENICFPN